MLTNRSELGSGGRGWLILRDVVRGFAGSEAPQKKKKSISTRRFGPNICDICPLVVLKRPAPSPPDLRSVPLYLVDEG